MHCVCVLESQPEKDGVGRRCEAWAGTEVALGYEENQLEHFRLGNIKTSGKFHLIMFSDSKHVYFYSHFFVGVSFAWIYNYNCLNCGTTH